MSKGKNNTEIKTAGFNIELIIESTNISQSNQLRDWRKLYERLSKPVKVNEQSSKQVEIHKSGLTLKQSYRKSFYFVGNSVSNNQSRINKRLINYRVM